MNGRGGIKTDQNQFYLKSNYLHRSIDGKFLLMEMKK